MRSVLGKTFGTVAAASALVLAVNSPAMAVTIEKETGTGGVGVPGSSNPPGTSGTCHEIGIDQSRGCFAKSGDIIYILDAEFDFHNAYARWDNDLKNASGDWVRYRSGECWNKSGAQIWAACNKDFYENDSTNAKNGKGSRVRLIICIDDVGDPTCSTGPWILNND
ncbi:hypothetical protein P1P68_14190 [Streptomyces scabiei]|uniref:hypothetical protein n=1 Tax=Streptomyces scabiei TaxID=1930 RepID=UPI00298F5850|nr:hypothetical protein [Streptomyces scabiei]MDW8805902.1 hypothetical protein [Streptomyces scabiei]